MQDGERHSLGKEKQAGGKMGGGGGAALEPRGQLAIKVNPPAQTGGPQCLRTRKPEKLYEGGVLVALKNSNSSRGYEKEQEFGASVKGVRKTRSEPRRKSVRKKLGADCS